MYLSRRIGSHPAMLDSIRSRPAAHRLFPGVRGAPAARENAWSAKARSAASALSACCLENGWLALVIGSGLMGTPSAKSAAYFAIRRIKLWAAAIVKFAAQRRIAFTSCRQIIHPGPAISESRSVDLQTQGFTHLLPI